MKKLSEINSNLAKIRSEDVLLAKEMGEIKGGACFFSCRPGCKRSCSPGGSEGGPAGPGESDG